MANIYNIEYKAVGSDSMLHRMHEHVDCFEIIQTWYNHGYVTIKDTVYPMETGNVYFINAIETHSTNPDCTEEYVRNKLFISGEYMKSLAAASGMSQVVKELFLDKGGRSCALDYDVALKADALFKDIQALYLSDSDVRIPLISSDIIRLVSTAYSNQKKTVYRSNRIIDETIAYVNNHIDEPITINDVCEAVNVNKYYLCHLFKKITDMTIFEYTRERRMSISRKLLISDLEMPISEVAMRAGFASFSYFNQAFKKMNGVTPGDYRIRYKDQQGLSD